MRVLEIKFRNKEWQESVVITGKHLDICEKAIAQDMNMLNGLGHVVLEHSEELPDESAMILDDAVLAPCKTDQDVVNVLRASLDSLRKSRKRFDYAM